MSKTIAFTLNGRVQGVGFRYATRSKALELGLSGWVRNRSDGDVEGMAGGEPEQIEAFVQWLKSGPPGSRVKNLQVTESSRSTGSDFKITR